MIYSSNVQNIENARNSMLAGVSERIAYEREHNSVPADLASITQFLVTFGKRVAKCDAFTLGFFAENAADFGNVFLSHRRTNACFNVYAMPKALATGRALNGSALSGDDANDETLAGVVLALSRGISNGKVIANALNDHMNRDGKRGSYSSGATQASSALRALEALGIVRETGRDGACKLWGVADAARFQRMLEAARGQTASAPASDVIDGEFDEVASELLALDYAPAPTAPLALPAPASVPAVAANKRAGKRSK